MNFDVISDIHLDFYIDISKPNKNKSQLEEFMKIFHEDKLSDNIIIAGDISHNLESSIIFFKELKKIYDSIIITWGNHDLYLTSNRIKKKHKFTSINRKKELKDFCEKEGIYFLDGNVIEIDGILIGGSCGWYKSTMEMYNNSNDFKFIYKSKEINQYNVYSSRTKKTDWDINKSNMLYEEEMDKLARLGKVDILVTHIPIYSEFSSRGLTDYSNREDILLNICPKYYIHGHIHETIHKKIEDVTVLCSPYGYPNEIKYKRLHSISI